MKRITTSMTVTVLLWVLTFGTGARAYVFDTTVPTAGGCPQPNHWNLSIANPLSRQWSTSLPLAPPTLLTAAAPQTAAQLTEIEQAISDSFNPWIGVTGTTFNSAAYPGLIAPLARVATQNACSNDTETNVDGVNTICFNQSSDGFAAGVLAFTRVITANAPGVSIGASAVSTFAGQILDSDTLFNNNGQVTFATPAGLATPQGQGAYDLESILTHELGHWFGLDHSAVWRAMMFPFAPPPGQFLGDRPTSEIPDGPLADDDRTGIRALYPDPNDSLHAGAIRGRIVPANPFALAAFAPVSTGNFVTGMVGAHVVAVDSGTGSVIAGALGGWTCAAPSSSEPPSVTSSEMSGQLAFDGSYDIERLPVGQNYLIYAEPIEGVLTPANFADALNDLCPASGPSACALPSANANFNPRIQPISH